MSRHDDGGIQCFCLVEVGAGVDHVGQLGAFCESPGIVYIPVVLACEIALTVSGDCKPFNLP